MKLLEAAKAFIPFWSKLVVSVRGGKTLVRDLSAAVVATEKRQAACDHEWQGFSWREYKAAVVTTPVFGYGDPPDEKGAMATLVRKREDADVKFDRCPQCGMPFEAKP